jgi:hypothetical protein
MTPSDRPPAKPWPHSAGIGHQGVFLAFGGHTRITIPEGTSMPRQTILLIAAAGTLALPAAAQTLDLPPRKAGLWEVTTTLEKPRGMPPMAAQMCLDAATDRDLMENALKLTGGNCTSLNTRRQGQTYVVDADCRFGSTTAKSKTVISGDFGSAYTLRMEGTTEDGAGKGRQPAVMTQTAKWKSANCPGMRPGDITMFGGIKVNIKQLKSLPAGLLR